MIALFMSTALLLGTTGGAVPQTTTTAPAQEKKTEEKDHGDEAGERVWERRLGATQAPKGRLREEVRRYIQDGKSGDPEEEGGEVVARRR